MAKVLIGCEYSGRVRDAFIRLGHEAVSCDFLATDVPGPHYQGDVFDIINDGWDMAIFFPPCTYLCRSGLHWNLNPASVRFGGKQTEEALQFVQALLDAKIPRIALENPAGCISSRIRKPDQTIQPYNFNEDASKMTCLWLKNLPKLQNTGYFPPRIVEGGKYDGKKRWSNQTDSGQNRLPPSEDRWKLRSETFQGVADAMAAQWAPLL
jgi:hypothetical protein